MSASSRNAMDRDGLNGSGFVESSDEWRSLFETSNESGTKIVFYSFETLTDLALSKSFDFSRF